ncbi:hypothetical protein QYG89_09815 [Bacillus sp. B190/17]|uniref:Uncharacterized protein n=1 Tax=Bacillus lumedeiriae TaxID=3058829 RepID=A0ABW8I914_9BACI
MLFHIIIGFILPWILGVYLFKNQTKLFLLFYPIGTASSFFINDIGFNYFWKLDHTFEELSLSAIPYNLGVYPILVCLFVCSIYYKKMPIIAAFLVFILGTTFAEFIVLLLEKVKYRNGWNIFWTGVSYLLHYLIVYIYYRSIRKFILLN